MRKIALMIAAILLTVSGFAQKQPKFTENDTKQFYNTVQGDYVMTINDSTTAMAHFAPIWENNRYQWLYLEAEKSDTVVLQKVIEIRPISDKVFKVKIYDLKTSERFVGKWGNPNFFDGFSKNILKGGKRLSFVKTSDFSYQTNTGPRRCSAIDCFPKGDLLHFKFVQEDERLYIKRMPKGTNRILGYQGFKEVAD